MAETLLDRKLGPASLVAAINGTPVALSNLGPVAIRHGRSKADGQPDASTVTLTTDSPIVPTVGQSVVVALGRDARVAFGLPADDLTNLLTNPRHGNGVVGYAGPVGATETLLTGLTVDGLAGVRAVRYTFPSLISSVDVTQARLSLPGYIPVPANQPMAASLWVRSSIAAQLRLQANLHDAAANYLTSHLSPTVVLVANTWTKLTMTGWTTPAGTTQGNLFLDSEEPMDWTAGATLDATLALWVPNATLPGYFDGDSTDSTTVTYFWTGTPYASSSVASSPAATRFSGTVTKASLQPEPGTAAHRRRVQVTATGPLAPLGRQLVGEAPWPQETDGARVARILGLATGISLGPVDSGTVQVNPRDVDRQPVLKLAQDVAVDADGILLQLRDGRVAYRDADHRQLVAEALELKASEVLWPVVWEQDLDGMVNDLTVTYGMAEPQAEYREVDDAAVAAFGLYASKVSTQLADATAAEAYALLTTARRGRPWWDLSTLTVDLVRAVDGGLHPQAGKVLALEVSDLLRITGWPTSGPQQLGRFWVEGWTETITAKGWRVSLAVTPYGRTGPGARWVDVQSTATWATFPAGLTWAQLASWDPGTTPGTQWYAAPSNLTWADAPATTWAAWPY